MSNFRFKITTFNARQKYYFDKKPYLVTNLAYFES